MRVRVRVVRAQKKQELDKFEKAVLGDARARKEEELEKLITSNQQQSRVMVTHMPAQGAAAAAPAAGAGAGAAAGAGAEAAAPVAVVATGGQPRFTGFRNAAKELRSNV